MAYRIVGSTGLGAILGTAQRIKFYYAICESLMNGRGRGILIRAIHTDIEPGISHYDYLARAFQLVLRRMTVCTVQSQDLSSLIVEQRRRRDFLNTFDGIDRRQIGEILSVYDGARLVAARLQLTRLQMRRRRHLCERSLRIDIRVKNDIDLM